MRWLLCNIGTELREELNMPMSVQVGDVLIMKKNHPCGCNQWEVLRIGADFKLRCKGCNHEVMGARSKFEKNIKQISREGKLL